MITALKQEAVQPTILDCMTDPALFGKQFSGKSWAAWRALLGGFYGLPLDKRQRQTFQALTSRRSPTSPCDELWQAIGRRGGKSQIAALLGVYEGAFSDYAAMLSPGEVATVMITAADRKQARTVYRYVTGLMYSNPMTESMIVSDTSDGLELSNRTVIEITTASFRAVRGYTLAAFIADEIAFWFSDGASPDRETISAVRPALATLNGKLIALSSPYARRGILWDQHRRYWGKSGPILVAQAPSRTMNPTLPQKVVDEAMERDPAEAKAEYLAEFRTDVEAFCTREAAEAVMRSEPLEIPYSAKHKYTAFLDAAGGSGSDSMTLSIAHRDDDAAVIDLVREWKPPFNPESVTAEAADILRDYRLSSATADRYAGQWVVDAFQRHRIKVEQCAAAKSDIYKDFLPLVNSQRTELPPFPKLINQLTGLERRTARGGRDSIDHAPNQHDDLINAAAGAATMVNARPRSWAGVW